MVRTVLRFTTVPPWPTIERSTLIRALNGALGIGVTKISSCAERLGTVRKSASTSTLRAAVRKCRRIGTSSNTLSIGDQTQSGTRNQTAGILVRVRGAFVAECSQIRPGPPADRTTAFAAWHTLG